MNEQDIFEVRQTDVEIQQILDQVPKNTTSIETINGKLPSEASPENPLADKEYVDGKVGEAMQAVNTEEARAKDAEQTLQGNINSEAQTRVLADQTLDGKIAAEKARAEGAEQTLQGNIESEAQAREQADTTLDGKIAANTQAIAAEKARAEGAEQTLQGGIDTINGKIPTQATSQNQLADKAFVNSTVATNTATYISNNGQPFASLAELQSYTGPHDNNDYAFVKTIDAVGNVVYHRYKYSDNTQQWALEYTLNNSSFTDAQWAAINSVITSGLVEKLNALPTKAQLDTLFSGKQDKLTFDSIPTKGSTNPVTSDGIAKAIETGQAEPYEQVTVTATANKGDVGMPVVTIYDEHDVVLASGEGTVSLRLKYGTIYKVGGERAYDYLTPAVQTFTAGQVIRGISLEYTYIERDVVTIDQTITDPATMLSGDIQGDVIKQIRAGSHLYLGTPATQKGDEKGTELICQLDDEDSTKYADGTTAILDGTEGDQWMKLPVFWWKITGIGEPDKNGAHDKYSFAYAIAGEPDPTWNKWEGDRNLLGAKKMKVVGGVGRSVSGGTGTASFTRAQGNTYAAANNLGCQEVTWEWQWMMCMLFYAWYGNTDSQTVCGFGSESTARTLGVTDTLGMSDTTPAQATSLTSVKFWGLEAWWNFLSEWMGNVTMSGYVLTIKDMNTKANRTVSGFVQCGGTGGYTSRMKISALGDFIPVDKSATAATSYCDWLNSNSGSRVLFRSNDSAYVGGGVAYLHASSTPSNTATYVGSRLAFNGVVTVAESVAAYKAALAKGE